MTDELGEVLSEAEALTFGPVVEGEAWNLQWLPLREGEEPDPIVEAVQRKVGKKPALGPVFNSDGVARAVIIRPCMSRGARLRGLRAIYTPQMLEDNATVFGGWPAYLDHKVEEAAKKGRGGRSVRELAGQILETWWDETIVMEGDRDFGYQKGAVVGEVWANDYVRGLVGNNPGMLHMSISAWPKSAKAGKAPWAPNGERGMIIEGIRRQPQGSVDFVPRGGAGGRLLPLKEGEQEGQPAAVEPGWSPEEEALAVSVAESVYAGAMSARDTTKGGAGSGSVPDFANMSTAEQAAWLRENAPEAVAQLAESAGNEASESGLTEAQVRAILDEERGEQTLTEAEVEAMLEERDAERARQTTLQARAHELIDASNFGPRLKASMKQRWAIGSPVLEGIQEADDKSEIEVLEAEVREELDEAEATIRESAGSIGRPRVTQEGGSAADPLAEAGQGTQSGGYSWRDTAAEIGVVSEADKAVEELHGVKVEG
jgi:hypothetical protein